MIEEPDAVTLALAVRHQDLETMSQRDAEIIKEIAKHPTHTKGIAACMEKGLLSREVSFTTHMSTLSKRGLLQMAKDLKQQATQIAIQDSTISHAHFLTKLLDEEVKVADQLLVEINRQGQILSGACPGSQVYSRALKNMRLTIDLLGDLTGVKQMREFEALKQRLELQVAMASEKEKAMKLAKDADDPANRSAQTEKPELDDHDIIE